MKKLISLFLLLSCRPLFSYDIFSGISGVQSEFTGTVFISNIAYPVRGELYEYRIDDQAVFSETTLYRLGLGEHILTVLNSKEEEVYRQVFTLSENDRLILTPREEFELSRVWRISSLGGTGFSGGFERYFAPNFFTAADLGFSFWYDRSYPKFYTLILPSAELGFSMIGDKSTDFALIAGVGLEFAFVFPKTAFSNTVESYYPLGVESENLLKAHEIYFTAFAEVRYTAFSLCLNLKYGTLRAGFEITPEIHYRFR